MKVPVRLLEGVYKATDESFVVCLQGVLEFVYLSVRV